MDNFENMVYHGSNEWIKDLKLFLDKIIEERKDQKYELFFRIYHDEHFEHRHIMYMKNTDELKNNAKKIFNITEEYKELKVFLRRLEDNYTNMIAKRKYKEVLELTENFFKI